MRSMFNQKKKNALLSFISTPIITVAESLIQVSLQLSASYYNQVKSLQNSFFKYFSSFCLVLLSYWSDECTFWNLIGCCRGRTPLVHPILHWSCLLSSHPAICIYNPERCTQVLCISWVIGLLEYVIDINI